MIVILPLLPIIIGVSLVGMSLLDKITPYVGPAATILWIITLIVFSVIIITGMTRKTSWPDKIFSTFFSLVAGFIGIFSSKTFFDGLASVESGFEGVINLVILVVLGGAVWLSTVGMCIRACLIFHDDYDDFKYAKSAGYIIGSALLASFFNLL